MQSTDVLYGDLRLRRAAIELGDGSPPFIPDRDLALVGRADPRELGTAWAHHPSLHSL